MTTADLVLSEDQQQALDVIVAWVGDGFFSGATKRELSLGGLAGSGKTTLVSRMLAHGPTVLAPTAKACAVLRRKGVPASTIHSAIYDFRGVNSEGRRPVLEFEEKGRSRQLLGNLVIVDESSMVTTPVAESLRGAVFARGGRILWVGDHGQLPPVGADPGLLRNPDLRLEKIHRQAEGNPILKVAHACRAGRKLIDAAAEHSGEHVRAVSCPTTLHLEELLATSKPDVVLVARNDTRRAINRVGWKLANLDAGAHEEYPHPFIGAPLMALRNAHKLGIVNGEQYTLSSFNPADWLPDGEEFAEVTLRDWLGGLTVAQAWVPCLGEGTDRKLRESSDVPYDVALLDFAFASTVHKAQGSEFGHVLVVDEAGRTDGSWDYPRWAYTAATRAKERLTVVRLGR